MRAAATIGQGLPIDASAFLPDEPTLPRLREAAQSCRGCELYAPATQTVFGEGGTQARLVLVGESPGDREDQDGRPFVGPAGREQGVHVGVTSDGSGLRLASSRRVGLGIVLALLGGLAVGGGPADAVTAGAKPTIVKANDADHDGVFNVAETVSKNASGGDEIPTSGGNPNPGGNNVP